jgi:hypothetical protein
MVARTCIFPLIIVAAALFSLNQVGDSSPASASSPIKMGDDAEVVAFRNEVEEAYETKDVGTMESWAETLRRDETRTAGGTTQLFEFYNVLVGIDCQCRDGTRKVYAFEDRKARLEEWLKKRPDSITATLAMATLWEYRSWQVVGGYANQTPLTEAQKQEFRDDRQTAWSYAQKLKVTDDPYVAFFTMRILEYTDATEADITRLYEQSIAAWPRHYQIYFLYAKTLPWHYNDNAGEVQLMRDLAAAKGDTDKQVGLSFIIGAMFHGFPFDGRSVSWPDVKQAYEIRRRHYGWRDRDLNTYCYLAIQAMDWPTAKDCMREINGRWDDVVWTSQNDFMWNEEVVSVH